jgi:DNA-binding LytR/AlgR family response regulator
MDTLIKILVVEDEMIIAAKISMQLTSLGYEVTGILPRGEQAIQQLKENMPDIILLDINLKGEIDGIETARKVQLLADIPIIYLTANSDEATFNRAKPTRPYAFISKPFKQLDLQRAIELTISRMAENATGWITENKTGEAPPFILSDRIFVRHKDKMIKIMLADILYLEADRNYSRIFTSAKEYVLAITLKTIEDKLNTELFMRIHRSYLVNIAQVDEVTESHVMIATKAIPLGSGMREQLMQRIKTL